jgi:hypothetical protein
MNIGELKKSYNNAIQPDPLQPIVECSLAWGCFKELLTLVPDGAENEEFGFSFGLANINDGITSKIDPNLFQVYFGRLIDAEKGSGWSTAEIDFYYRFEMTDNLRKLLNALPCENVETAYFFKEGQPAISDKRTEVVYFADLQTEIWAEIRPLKPTLASYHFWVW